MKEKALRYGIYFSGAICLLIFILIRIKGAQRIIINPDYQTKGELFSQTYIEDFDEDLPPLVQSSYETNFNSSGTGRNKPDLSRADIFIFGDSYGYYPRGISFPELLAKKLGKEVYFDTDNNPFNVFKKSDFQNQHEEKIVIAEFGERGLFIRFENEVRDDLPEYTFEESPVFQILPPGEAEKRYTWLLQRSIFTSYIYRKISTFQFRQFGYISDYTPKYSTEPPVLFYFQTVNDQNTSYFYDLKDEELQNAVENIKRLQRKLRDKYNMKLLIMPVPNKVSIYDNLLGLDAYNNLLPRLYRMLEKEEIPYIDLYTTFRNSDDFLYYRTDTHWNQKGIDLAVEETVRSFNQKGWK